MTSPVDPSRTGLSVKPGSRRAALSARPRIQPTRRRDACTGLTRRRRHRWSQPAPELVGLRAAMTSRRSPSRRPARSFVTISQPAASASISVRGHASTPFGRNTNQRCRLIASRTSVRGASVISVSGTPLFASPDACPDPPFSADGFRGAHRAASGRCSVPTGTSVEIDPAVAHERLCTRPGSFPARRACCSCNTSGVAATSRCRTLGGADLRVVHPHQWVSFSEPGHRLTRQMVGACDDDPVRSMARSHWSGVTIRLRRRRASVDHGGVGHLRAADSAPVAPIGRRSRGVRDA